MTRELRNVYICGAQSTGKTTLIKFLHQYSDFVRLGVKLEEEIGRKIVLENGYTQEMLQDTVMFRDLNFVILKRLEEALMQSEKENDKDAIVMWDRGCIDALTYLSVFIGEEALNEATDLPHVQRMLTLWKNKEKTQVFVVAPCRQFLVDDNVRVPTEGYTASLKFHNKMISLLQHHDINFVEIKDTDLLKRAEIVTKTVTQKWCGRKS